jgi:hypothetical protein
MALVMLEAHIKNRLIREIGEGSGRKLKSFKNCTTTGRKEFVSR